MAAKKQTYTIVVSGLMSEADARHIANVVVALNPQAEVSVGIGDAESIHFEAVGKALRVTNGLKSRHKSRHIEIQRF